MPDELTESLIAIGENGEVFAEMLWKKQSNVSQNAYNNRLEKLRIEGLAKRERFGKVFKYSLTKLGKSELAKLRKAARK